MTRKPPLYQIVRDGLRHRIETGHYRVGDQLPGEETLAEEFGCSRLTAHRALRELADLGFVERRPRAGTRVLPRGGGVMIRIPSIREEIEAQGHIYRYELLQRRLAKPSKAVAEGLGVDEDTRLLNLRCRHWAGRQVFQYENRWINPDSAPGASEQSFEDFGPNDWLINTVPYSNVDHEISAVSATRITAPVMDVPVATPLLQVRRLTSLHGIGVTAVTLLHPGHDYVLRSAHSTETSQT